MASKRRPVTPKLRDGFQVATAALTGVATFGALAGTGLLAGEMANSYQEEQADRAEAAAQAAGQVDPVAQVIEKRRPHRTVVKTTVVDRVSATGYTAPGPGGTVTSRPGGSSSAGSSTGGGTGKGSGGGSQASNPVQAPAPPPPPKPAPSSGS